MFSTPNEVMMRRIKKTTGVFVQLVANELATRNKQLKRDKGRLPNLRTMKTVVKQKRFT